MAEKSALTTTEIVIGGYNNDSPVVFSNLSLSEGLIHINSFSFAIRPASKNNGFGTILDFKKQVLGKPVRIDFKDGDGVSNHKFSGVVLEINSSLLDDHFYEFYITGSGDFCKVNEIAEWHSFYKKKLDAVIDKAFEKSELKDKVKKNPQTTKELHYTVQYNQSLFSFMSALAIRFGEWMFYDGENLQFGKKPEGEAVELKSPGDVANLNIRAQSKKNFEGTVATDIFKSEVIKSASKENAPDNDFIKAVEDSGKNLFENPAGSTFLSSGFNQADSDDKYKLEQQATLASSVFITGTTRNNKVFIGKKIKIKDASDDSGKTFIIVQIQHNASNYSNYSNSFTAVPLEVDVPPYTNPLLTPKAAPQAAIITDNEDDAGMARVKVKFPWMADDEKTPWISVLVPHAGKDKGFRFLPEKDDEVMVDFWDNNAEMPFVNGSLYTEKNKPEIDEKGNYIKMIGTKTGRRFEIDDDKGTISVMDNFKDKNPKNGIQLRRKDDENVIIIRSQVDDDNSGIIELSKDDWLGIAIVQDGSEITEIKLEKSGKKIKISSKGSIEIKADNSISLTSGDINLNAQNINLKADKNIKIEGTQKLEAKALEVKLEADTTLEAKGGVSAKVEGTKLDLNGSAITSIQGALVKIN